MNRLYFLIQLHTVIINNLNISNTSLAFHIYFNISNHILLYILYYIIQARFSITTKLPTYC